MPYSAGWIWGGKGVVILTAIAGMQVRPWARDRANGEVWEWEGLTLFSSLH